MGFRLGVDQVVHGKVGNNTSPGCIFERAIQRYSSRSSRPNTRDAAREKLLFRANRTQNRKKRRIGHVTSVNQGISIVSRAFLDLSANHMCYTWLDPIFRPKLTLEAIFSHSTDHSYGVSAGGGSGCSRKSG